MGVIDERKEYSLGILKELKSLLAEAERVASDNACVFAHGSFGRLEASNHSDLDPCIVSLCDEGKKSKLTLLHEIRLKAELITAIRNLDLPDIDGDGRYLGQFNNYSLVNEIGSPVDDSDNTFTTRLLMLLEGRAIVNEHIFDSVKSSIIRAYWVDFDTYKSSFIPAYFTNDIIRLWRTFCINYEARTRNLPEDQRIKRKVKLYKLKHSRILTCYSAILYLLAIYRLKNTVDRDDALTMCSLTPLERLVWLRDNPELSTSEGIMQNLIDMYENFLHTASQDAQRLEQQIKNNEGYAREDYRFGQEMFSAIASVGDGNKFHRLIVV